MDSACVLVRSVCNSYKMCERSLVPVSTFCKLWLVISCPFDSMFLSTSIFEIDSHGFCLLIHKEADVFHSFTIAKSNLVGRTGL
jgi:hypothetical protein